VEEEVESPPSYLYRISILNCGDSMTEERKHAILLATVILKARPLQPLLEEDFAGGKKCKRLEESTMFLTEY
jgi:hypothetical protein